LLPASATTTTTTTKGLDMTDFPSVTKKATKDGSSATLTVSTFQVAILPTKQQRQVLQSMLRVSNMAFNWADYLVTKCNIRPSLYGLQKSYVKGRESGHGEKKSVRRNTQPIRARLHRIHDLGAAKQYICDKCGYDVDRDVNGTRNILRRALGLLLAPRK
jgi:hypothetical protein